MSDILVVDDERDIRELICDILEDEGFTTRMAGTSDECMAELNKSQPGLMILDIWLKDSSMDGIDILGHVKRDNPEVPVVIISGHGNVEIAVAAIKQGAYDFIEKPFNIDQLMVVIKRAMETSRLRRENTALRRQDSRSTEMIGSSSAFRTLKNQLDKVTKSNGRVMLTGGPGIGRYLAIATSADAVVTDSGGLEAITAINGVVAYRHLWNGRLRSTVAVSGLFIDNDTALTGNGLTESVMSARANIIYEPVAKLLIGFELLQAVRNLENGLDGDHTRPQVSLKYSF